MASTTTNYGWVVPTSSDLVKNGATAISTVGSSVDTSLWNSGFGQAGKNKIINGDCTINQRGTTSSTTNSTYLVDRFRQNFSGGTVTGSVQALTAGAAPVTGYEAKQNIQIVTSGQSAAGDYAFIYHGIEDVRTFAGQTVTLSFWAKAASGTPSIAPEFVQYFGTGGSPSATIQSIVATTPKQAITTSWARYSYIINMPSLSGKTVGTDANSSSLGLNLWVSAGTTFNTRASSLGVQNNTFSLWGMQLEYGSVATPFQLASGWNPQSELAMCQRYCQVFNATNWRGFTGQAISTSRVFAPVTLPVQMRTSPTVTFSAVGDFVNNDATGNGRAVVTATTEASRAANIMLDMTSTGVFLLAGNAVNVTNANSNAVITIAAEV
jgi:hypothetical protein